MTIDDVHVTNYTPSSILKVHLDAEGDSIAGSLDGRLRELRLDDDVEILVM